MSTAPRVEYDESFRRDPALVSRAGEAVERLRGRGASVRGETTFHWELVPGDETVAELTITEPDEDGPITVRDRFPARFLADRVNANISVWWVWDELLGARSDRRMGRIARDVALLVAEERVDAAEPTHAP